MERLCRVETVADVLVEPVALELRRIHILCAADEASALGGLAKALEGLGHVPFGRWVEELSNKK